MRPGVMDLNRLREAESEFDAPLDQSEHGAWYLNRSHLYQRTGRKTQALDDAERAQSLGVKVDPQYSTVSAENFARVKSWTNEPGRPRRHRRVDLGARLG